MTMRERPHHDTPRMGAPGAPMGNGSVRASAERFLAQGADAIERALSQNSAAFLAANRQEGGQ